MTNPNLQRTYDFYDGTANSAMGLGKWPLYLGPKWMSAMFEEASLFGTH